MNLVPVALKVLLRYTRHNQRRKFAYMNEQCRLRDGGKLPFRERLSLESQSENHLRQRELRAGRQCTHVHEDVPELREEVSPEGRIAHLEVRNKLRENRSQAEHVGCSTLHAPHRLCPCLYPTGRDTGELQTLATNAAERTGPTM